MSELKSFGSQKWFSKLQALDILLSSIFLRILVCKIYREELIWVSTQPVKNLLQKVMRYQFFLAQTIKVLLFMQYPVG